MCRLRLKQWTQLNRATLGFVRAMRLQPGSDGPMGQPVGKVVPTGSGVVNRTEISNTMYRYRTATTGVVTFKMVRCVATTTSVEIPSSAFLRRMYGV